ncbi:hypothetical protein BDZ89DRAFT_596958 [Hymenopellis radicata]|nr:hypothetical protein BDZ89DRAFT_596958 [Hymenopellis radicata]
MKPSAELAVIAAEIERVKLVLQALEEQHAYLDTHVTRTRQFIQPSPIRKLPTEVLGIIFEHVCASDLYSEYRGTAICLSVVCSKWRSITMSTPALWTTIVYADSPEEVNYYLDRCGKLPLRVHVESPLAICDRFLDDDTGMPCESSDTMQRFLKTLPNGNTFTFIWTLVTFTSLKTS